MPDHFHALIWPTADASSSKTVQRLEDRTGFFILLGNGTSILAMDTVPSRMTEGRIHPDRKGRDVCATRTRVRHHAHFRAWQRRFYDMNVWTPKKRDEKLNYMHNNPVKRGSVKQPGDCPSSC
jgi:REP element-mobilizing transposase RayT